MSGGRIRSLKPEILEDEKVAELSDCAFRIFVASITLADDHGNLRWTSAYLRGAIWWNRDITLAEVAAAASEVERNFTIAYTARGQTYAHIRNWKKHQRISNAGNPKVPPFMGDDSPALELPRNSSAELSEIRLARAPAHPAAGMGEGDGKGDGEGESREGRVRDPVRTSVDDSPEDNVGDAPHPLSSGLLPAAQPFRAGAPIRDDEAPQAGTLATATGSAHPASAQAPSLFPTEPASAVVAKAPKTRKEHGGPKSSRITDAFTPSPATVERFRKEGYDALAHREEFINHWFNESGSKAMKVDWDRTFVNRMNDLIRWGKATEWKAPRPSAVRPVAARPPIDPEERARIMAFDPNAEFRGKRLAETADTEIPLEDIFAGLVNRA